MFNVKKSRSRVGLARSLAVLGLILVMGLLFGAMEATSQTQKIIVLNTGYDQANSQLIAVGQLDDEWRVIVDPLNPPTSIDRPANVVAPYNAPYSWAYPFPNSQWISASPSSYELQLPTPPTTFTYDFYFNLPQGFSNPQLNLQLRADEQIDLVEMGGNNLYDVSQSPGPHNGGFNGPPLILSATTGFQVGLNALTIVYSDLSKGVTGLNVAGEVTYECCLDLEFAAGENDDFAQGNDESANTPPGIPPSEYMGEQTAANFDGTKLDQYFGHRFVLPPGQCVSEATLEFRAKPIGASNNDSIRLQIGSELWVSYFGSGNSGQGMPLQPGPWNSSNPNVNAGHQFSLNLESLAVTGLGNSNNLLAELQQNRILDVIVQDDSSVDYLALKVKFCDCGPNDTGGCISPPANMVAWWPFDEPTGATVFEDIVGQNDGTPAGNGLTSVANEYVGNSLKPGIGSYVKVSSSSAFNFGTGPFTLDAWIKPGLADQIEPIVSKLDVTTGYFLFVQQGALFFQTGKGLNASYFKGPSVQAMSWNFVAAVVSPPANLTLFVGDPITGNVSSVSFTGVVINASNTVSLDIGLSPFNPHPNGILIDELEIFNRGLGDDEIEAIFAADKLGKCRNQGMICGIKFNDLNGNGLQDPGEPGLPGVTIQAHDASGNVVATATTGLNGEYCIQVPFGTYTITEVVQSGWIQTFPTSSDAHTISVSATQLQVNGINFGNMEMPGTAEICVLKFEDEDGDGVQDPNEHGLPGWTFSITNAGGTFFATGTTVGGPPSVACSDVPAPGTYTITEQLQPGWIVTTPNPQMVSVAADQHVDLKFGNMREGPCDLFAGKSLARGIIPPLQTGQQVIFEMIVSNEGTGPCDASIPVTDTFNGMTYESGGQVGPAPSWTCPTGPATSPVMCSYSGTLQAGQISNFFMTFTVTADPGDEIENCIEVTHHLDGNETNNQTCVTVQVAESPPPACDLSIRKTVTPDSVNNGGTATFTLTVINVREVDCEPGPFPGTVLRDNQLTGLTLNLPVAIGQSGGSVTWQCGQEAPSGNLTCASQNLLPVNYSATFEFTATVSASPGSTITNCATVTNTNDTNQSNNEACADITVKKYVTDLSLNLDLEGTLRPGEQVTYRLTVTNLGEQATTQPISITDMLPSNLELVSIEGAGWTCFSFGQLLNCNTTASISPGGTSTLLVHAKVRGGPGMASPPPGTIIINCAAVSMEGDENSENNRACITNTVQ